VQTLSLATIVLVVDPNHCFVDYDAIRTATSLRL
jgi:hypothetical protein